MQIPNTNPNFRSDLSHVPACPECGSLDVERDIATGKIKCRKCGYTGEKKNFDFESLSEKLIAQEIANIQDHLKHGEQITIHGKTYGQQQEIVQKPIQGQEPHIR